jgi:hypothetical protein
MSNQSPRTQEHGRDQGGARLPTVGDTVVVIHRVLAPPGALVQPGAPRDSTIATLLRAPDVVREGDSVRIAYTLTVWSAGRHEVVLPGAIVVGIDGKVDTLADARIGLEVASLLPADTPIESIPPQAARPWVPRADRTELPFLVILPLVAALILLAGWLWRRRGPAIPPPPRDPRAGLGCRSPRGLARRRRAGVGGRSPVARPCRTPGRVARGGGRGALHPRGRQSPGGTGEGRTRPAQLRGGG